MLFLLLYSLQEAYSFQRRLSILERRDPKAPDAVALSCGIATLLQQFHTSYGEVKPNHTHLSFFVYIIRGQCCRLSGETPVPELAARKGKMEGSLRGQHPIIVYESSARVS